jgi:hypothetical protein
MNQLKPNVPLIQNPIGLDREIQRLQLAIGRGLPWLEYSFGRATPGQVKGPGREDMRWWSPIPIGRATPSFR